MRHNTHTNILSNHLISFLDTFTSTTNVNTNTDHFYKILPEDDVSFDVVPCSLLEIQWHFRGAD